MGLDQYIYRVSKPELEDKVYTTKELGLFEELHSTAAIDFETNDCLYKELAPYVVKRDVQCELYDVEKMIADYNLPKDSHIWRYIGGGITIGGRDKDGNRIDQEISDKEIAKKYTKTSIITHYIWKAKEVQYWRKHYELQDWIYDNIDTAENTAYCMLNANLIAELNEMFDECIPEKDPTAESALFYWEWY